jgi:hypothetical protein
MVKINPSLMFSGTSGEAFRRYALPFGGEIVNLLTYAESPLAREVPPEWRHKVWCMKLLAAFRWYSEWRTPTKRIVYSQAWRRAPT